MVTDEIHLLSVQKEEPYAGSIGISSVYAIDSHSKAREAEKQRATKLLRGYARRAHQFGV
jgi:hypothetical protein